MQEERRTANAVRIYTRLVRAVLAAVPARQAPEGEKAPLDPELEERLKSLGYVD